MTTIILTAVFALVLSGTSILLLIQMIDMRSRVSTLEKSMEQRDELLYQLIQNQREQEQLNNITMQAIGELQEDSMRRMVMYSKDMGQA
jgi:mannose/fructose-specific phosphotransferase system component IIA